MVRYKPILITNFTLPKLGATITGPIFSEFKDYFINELQIHALSHYIQYDHTKVCQFIHNTYKNADSTIVSAHVKSQSVSLAGISNKAFVSQHKTIRDSIISKHGELQINNVYIMWSVILETYENANQAHISNLIFALTNIKHQSHVDPFIIYYC